MAKKKQPELIEEPRELPRRELMTITSRKPLIFISHDSRNEDLAEEFANLLSDVSGGTLKSFRSSDKKGTTGIEFGSEWYKAIMSKLGDATDIVALLTQESIDRPWILYESGVAAGKLDTAVIGLVLGVPLDKANSGPFGQFHNCGDDEDSVTKLVIQLISRNPEASPREETVRKHVREFLASANGLMKKGAKTVLHTPKAEEEQSVARLFEEIKIMIGNLALVIDSRTQVLPSLGKMRREAPSPPDYSLLARVCDRTLDPDERASAWAEFAICNRDRLPYLYTFGQRLFSDLRKGNEERVSMAARALKEALHQMLDQEPGINKEFGQLYVPLFDYLDGLLDSERQVLELKKRQGSGTKSKKESE